MDFWEKIGLALAIGGIGLSIAAFFAAYVWRELPRWLALTGVALGITLCLSAIPCFLIIPDPARPDVTARFVNPQSPMLVLDNSSDAIARDIKKMTAIWNADDLRTYVAGSSGNDPLPIPISTFDVLRPRTASGPESIFQSSVNAGYIKRGNRLIGSIGLVCPTCTRGHSYFVYIIWGKSGWLAEIPQSQEGEVTVPQSITTETLKTYFNSIEQLPDALRHPIAKVD